MSDVRRVGQTTLAVDSGGEAELYQYRATFEYESMTFPLAEGEEIRIPAGSFDVAGEYAIWHDGEHLFVAGGAIPAENFAESIERPITDAITVSVSIDLGLDHEELHEELRALVKSVG